MFLVNNGERDISYASPVTIIIKVNVIALTPSASISASAILGFPTNVERFLAVHQLYLCFFNFYTPMHCRTCWF